MARSAVLAGRTLADLVRNVGVVALMVAMGYLVGFRVQTSPLALLAAVGLPAAVRLRPVVGVRAGRAVGAQRRERQAASFPLLFPLVFASSAFVPTATMPGPLRAFAEHQPVTAGGRRGPRPGARRPDRVARADLGGLVGRGSSPSPPAGRPALPPRLRRLTTGGRRVRVPRTAPERELRPSDHEASTT
jgi:hypothetical protein